MGIQREQVREQDEIWLSAYLSRESFAAFLVYLIHASTKPAWLGIEPSMFGYTPPEVPTAGTPYELARRRIIRLAGGQPGREIMPARGLVADLNDLSIDEGVPHDSVGVRPSGRA